MIYGFDVTPQLSDRELEILNLICDGLSNQEIADSLVLSRGAVKAHSHRIYTKLDVKNRTQATLKAQALGLIGSPATEPEAPSKPLSTSPATKLPAITTPLIGRAYEIEQIGHLLHDDRIRLITLLGTGGMGKTRLAVEIGYRYEQDFANGVGFVALSAIQNPKNFASYILSELGVQVLPNDDTLEQLLNYLQHQQMLVILDNFEHLITAADTIFELLEACPKVNFLVTSRVRLNLNSEVTFVLEGLPFDVENGSELQHGDALTLLEQCAQKIQPRFELDSNTLLSALEICRLTQGMPLGIILAMSWFEMLSLQEIASEVQQNLNILQSDFQDLPPRQRNMRAMIETSWQRLMPQYRRVFAGLSIFRDGFSRNGAEAVTGANLFILKELVDRSWLSVSDGRYFCHELLRQYGLEMLHQMQETKQLLAQHSRHYLEWLAELESEIKGENQIEVIRAIQLELQNINLAIEYAVHHQELDWISNALESLSLFSQIGIRVYEVGRQFEYMLENLEGKLTSEVIDRVRFRLYRIWVASGFGHVNEDELFELAEQLAANSNDLEVALLDELIATYCGFYQNDYPKTIEILERAAIAYDKLGEPFYLAGAYHKLAYFHFQATNTDAAISYTNAALQTATMHHNPYNIRHATASLASTATLMGQYEAAERHFETGLALVPDARDSNLMSVFTMILLGKIDAARNRLNHAWHGQDGDIEVMITAYVYALFGMFAVLDEDYFEALRLLEHCLAIGKHHITVRFVGYAVLSMTYCGLGAYEKVQQTILESMKLIQATKFYAVSTWSLPSLVLLQKQSGNIDDSIRYIALLRTHPLSATQWLDSWPLYARSEQILNQSMSKSDYHVLWENGKLIELESLVNTYVLEYS